MIAPAELASNVIAMEKKRLAASNSRTQTDLTRQVFQLHLLETLLHTMRCIAQYEDVLCELSHEIRTAGRVSNQASAELRSIVNNLPSEDYMHDLNSVRAIFVEVKPSKPSSLKRKKKPGKLRKRYDAAAKTKTTKKASR
jgi:hypothetical protein